MHEQLLRRSHAREQQRDGGDSDPVGAWVALDAALQAALDGPVVSRP